MANTALQSQLEILNGLYKWADFEDEDHRSLHRDRLAEPMRLEQTLPDILTGLQGRRQVTLRVKPIAVAPGVVAGGVDRMPGTGNSDLSLADVLHGSTGLHGEVASVRLADLDNSVNYLPMAGVISDVNISTGELQIDELDAGVLQTEIPRRRLIDLFPAADLTRAPGADPRVIKPFRVMRQVLLTCLSADRKDFGAVVSHPSLLWSTVYRNKAVVPTGDYTTGVIGGGLQIVRFVRAQADDAEIRADLASTEMTNQSTAGLWILSDPVDGLGQLISVASFGAASTILNALGYFVNHGIGPEPIRAEDVLNEIAVRGSVIARDAGYQYTWTVDAASLHTAPTYQSKPYQLGRGDGRWENITRVTSSRQKRIEERINDYTLQGLYSAGFGSETYLIKARTKRNAKGTEKTVQTKYIGDLVTLRKEAGYRMRRLAAEEHSVEVETSSEAKVISLNQVVPVTVPYLRLGPGNPPFPLMVKRLRGSRGNWSFDLVGYDASQYTAEAEQIWAATAASFVTDFTFTFPLAVSGFTLIGSDVVSIGDQGKSKTYRKVQATAPAANVTHLIFRLRRDGQTIPLRSIEVAANPSQTVQVELEADSGLDYSVETFARNKNNAPEFQDGAISQITGYHASGDPSTPPQVTGFSLTTGAYKSLTAKWNDVGISNLLSYDVQISLDSGFSSIIRELTPTTRDVAINGLANGTTYWGRCRAFNRSFTGGAFSNSDAATTLLVDTADIGDDKVTTSKFPNGAVTSPKRANVASVTVNVNFFGATHDHTGSPPGVTPGQSVLEHVQVTLSHGLGKKPLGISTATYALTSILASSNSSITVNLYNPVKFGITSPETLGFDFF